METTMRANARILLAAGTLASAIIFAAGGAYGQSARFDALANLPFEENRPTEETAQTLPDELLFQRATQSYLWALPLINTSA
jgi:hypothetical protein